MKLRFLPAAEIDIDEAATWYRNRAAGLDVRLIADVRTACAQISKYPRAWHPITGSLRQIRLTRFPYALVYAVEADCIVIVAFIHLRRKPRDWKDRYDR